MIWCVTLNPSLDVTLKLRDPLLESINRAEQSIYRAGGKGNNVARAVCQLGQPVTVVTVLGGQIGQLIRQLLTDAHIPCLITESSGQTRQCFTLIDPDGSVKEIREPGPPVSELSISRLLSDLSASVAPDDYVVFSGSLPPNLAPTVYGRWIKELMPKTKGVLVDTSGPALQDALAAGPTAVFPNLSEFCGLPPSLAESSLSKIVVTLGADGVKFWDNGTCRRILAPKVSMKNPVGAGDALLGGVVAYLSKGHDWHDALRHGVSVGSASTELLGTGDFSTERCAALYATLTELAYPCD